MQRRLRIGAGALLFGIALLSCDATLAPPDGEEFVPPAKFRSLWRTVELCGGRTGAFDDVTWFVTQGSAGARGQADIAGSWWPDGNRIYLNAAFVDDEGVVRHEMLHALLQGRRHEPAFLTSCGGLVPCIENCISEAGGLSALPGPSAPLVLPAELDVQLTIVPPTPGDEGWATVIVSATNTRAEPVRVDLAGRAGVEFECLLNGFICATFYFGSSSPASFRAGETRREASVFPALPGTYEITGGYNTKQAPPGILVVP
jgi:hypothetical protein